MDPGQLGLGEEGSQETLPLASAQVQLVDLDAVGLGVMVHGDGEEARVSGGDTEAGEAAKDLHEDGGGGGRGVVRAGGGRTGRRGRRATGRGGRVRGRRTGRWRR